MLLWVIEWLSDLSPAGYLILFLLYFMPTFAALFRKRNWVLKLIKVFCLNFFLGWTLFGWYAAWKYAQSTEPRLVRWFVSAMKAWWKEVEEPHAGYSAPTQQNAPSTWTPTIEPPPAPPPFEPTYSCPNGSDGLKYCVSCKGVDLPCHDCGGRRRVHCSDCQGLGWIKRSY